MKIDGECLIELIRSCSSWAWIIILWFCWSKKTNLCSLAQTCPPSRLISTGSIECAQYDKVCIRESLLASQKNQLLSSLRRQIQSFHSLYFWKAKTLGMLQANRLPRIRKWCASNLDHICRKALSWWAYIKRKICYDRKSFNFRKKAEVYH